MAGTELKLFALILLLLNIFPQGISKKLKSVATLENCFLEAVTSNEEHAPPVCTFETSPNFPLENITCVEKGIMRIIGDYDAVRINCTASFPLDFDFTGVMPTEAISVNLRSTVVPNTDRENISYHADLKIYSVTALFNLYNASHPGEHSSPFAYSRTGNYIFSGYHEFSDLFTSIYIFFEEPAVTPDFIRNKNIVLRREGASVQIPCRSTHYNSNVTLFENGVKTDAQYLPTTGFKLPDNDAPLLKLYTCSLRYNELEIVIVVPTNLPAIESGEPGSSTRTTPVITSNLQPISFGSYGTKISCRISDMDSYGDSAMLAAIGATNAPTHKLIRDFTLPDFVNRSYSILVGKRENDFKTHLKIKTLIPEHVISAVCGNASVRSAMSVGTTISCEIFPFPFNQVWSSLDRDLSNADRYFLLGNNDENDQFYEHQEIEFKCRISAFIMMPPAIWYITYANGTVNEEFIDDDWPEGISHFRKNVTSDMEEVTCAASIWFKNEWWNMSAPIKIRHSELPAFDEEASTRPEESFNAQAKRLIRCKANGIPTPVVYWIRNGNRITDKTLEESIFQFKRIKKSDEGDYFCIAQNSLGMIRRKVTLSVVSGPNKTSLIIGLVSAVVVAICVGILIYVQFCKKKKGGLTKAEIVEFMEGRGVSSYQAQNEVYKSLYGVIPYNKQFEISQNRFQIDKTYILGSGAYGVVYKGILDGIPVAVKTAKELADSSYLKSLLAELKVMIYLEHHQNLIKLVGAYTKKLYKGKAYVFVEYCALGSLEKFLRTNRGSACLEESPDEKYILVFGKRIYSKIGVASNTQCTITIKDLYNWSVQIAQGMAYLSKKKVIHGDLAARNVLLTASRTVKITDFGLSRRLYDYAEYVRKKEERLPWRWLALESLKDLSFSTQSDIWSYGVTLWEIFTLAETPYSGANFGISFITQIENGMRLPPPQFASTELYNSVMMDCWNSNPDERPSFAAITNLLKSLRTTVKSPTTYLPNNILYTCVSPKQTIS